MKRHERLLKMPISEKDQKFYDRVGIPVPSSDAHGEDSWEHPVSENLKPVNPSNWHQDGNKLICDTEYGPLVQLLPTDTIMVGTDDKGLPILKNIYKN